MNELFALRVLFKIYSKALKLYIYVGAALIVWFDHQCVQSVQQSSSNRRR